MSDISPIEIGNGIMAMTEDDGTVVTLLKRDPEHGAVYRHDGEWLPLVDPGVLDDLAFVGVTDDAEEMYDSHEAKDELVSLGHYIPSVDGPFWPYAVTEVEHAPEVEEVPDIIDADEEGDGPTEGDESADEEEALAASVILSGADDLDAAIAAAVADPNYRWYVERRVAALGLEADLPWLKG